MNRRILPLCLLLFTIPVLGSIVLACGSAKQGGLGQSVVSRGASDETQSEVKGPREPGRLKSMDGRSDTGSPAEECSLSGALPPEVPKNADADTLHGLGQERILAKRGDEAVIILGAAVKLDPDNGIIVGDYATALVQCRFYEEAIVNARRAASLEPENVDIAANLAQIYQIAGRIDEAIASYREAIDVDPSDHAAHNNLAVLLVLDDLKDAEKEARRASNLAPDNASYLVNLGYILFRQKRFVDAEMILERALEVDDESADAHNQIGLLLAAQNRREGAMEHFRRALELRPDHMAAKENLEAMERGNGSTDTLNKE